MKKTAQKLILAAATCLSVVANAHTQVEVNRAEEVSLVVEASKNAGARSTDISEETVDKLTEYAVRLRAMTLQEIGFEKGKMEFYRDMSCLAGEAVILAGGISEAVPAISGGIKLMTDGAKVGTKAMSVKDVSEGSQLGLWGISISGGILASIPGVIVETVASWDIKKVEAVVQKNFPGATILAKKVRGENSKCGELTIRTEMLKLVKASLESAKNAVLAAPEVPAK